MNFTQTNLNKTLLIPQHKLATSRTWWHVDATWKTLWKLAVIIADKLQWKHKPWYTDFRDAWDFVIVTNVDKIVVTGNKLINKIYYKHSGHKGHLKESTLQELLVKHPTHPIILAVKWMLPKNKLRNPRLKRLKTFNTDLHGYKVITQDLVC
jgi:large subunit ribosomal protein L13